MAINERGEFIRERPIGGQSGTPAPTNSRTPSPPSPSRRSSFPAGFLFMIALVIVVAVVYSVSQSSSRVASPGSTPAQIALAPITVTAAVTCVGEFTSNGPDCQADDSRLHLGSRFNYSGASPNQTTMRIEWKKDGLLLGQWPVTVPYASGSVWQNYTSPTELASGTYDAILSSGDQELGRTQVVLPPSAAELQARSQAARGEIANARQLFEKREYKAAVESCDRAISMDPDSTQDAVELRQQIVRTMEILGAPPPPPGQAAASIPSVKPSFDCNQAATPSERLICSDQYLAGLDVQMVGAFKEALSRLPESGQTQLRSDHQQWFKNYARTCNAAAGDLSQLRHCVETFLSEHRDQLRSR